MLRKYHPLAKGFKRRQLEIAPIPHPLHHAPHVQVYIYMYMYIYGWIIGMCVDRNGVPVSMGQTSRKNTRYNEVSSRSNPTSRLLLCVHKHTYLIYIIWKHVVRCMLCYYISIYICWCIVSHLNPIRTRARAHTPEGRLYPPPMRHKARTHSLAI